MPEAMHNQDVRDYLLLLRHHLGVIDPVEFVRVNKPPDYFHVVIRHKFSDEFVVVFNKHEIVFFFDA
jgi:hypothetical protein